MSRRKSQEVSLYSAGELTLPVDSEVERVLYGVLGRGLLSSTAAEVNGAVARARISEARRTTHQALDAVADLSRREAVIARELPHAIPRVQAIVDTFTYLTLDELRRLERRG